MILVSRFGVGGLLKELQIVDHVFEVKKGNAKSYQDVLVKLKPFHLKRVFSPHESLRTCIFVSQMKAEVKVGFRRIHTFPFYNQLIEKPQALPDSIRQLSLLKNFDSRLAEDLENIDPMSFITKDEQSRLSPPPPWASMRVQPPEALQIELESKLLSKLNSYNISSKPWVALFPGSVWATKRWTLEGFTELATELSSEYQVFLMGGPGEELLCNQIKQHVPSAINICGLTSLAESFMMLKKCLFVVGNDSASMHLSSLAGTPVFAIFGPTVLAQGFRPWNQKTVIIEKSLPCRPCGRHGHHKCPIGTHECMTSIKSQTVLEAILQNNLSQ